MKSNYKNTIYLLLAITVLTSGCRAFKAVKMPESKEMPSQFVEATSDTTTIADISWREFFKDQHLVALIDQAQANNFDALIAMYKIQGARATLRAGRGALAPNLGIEAGASGRKFGDYTMEGVGNYDTNLSGNINNDQRVSQPIVPDLSIFLTSSWEIDIWGKLRNRKNAAKSRYLGSIEGQKFMKTLVTETVAKMYYKLLALDAQLKIADENIILQEQGLEIVDAQKEGGRANQLAVERFKAQMLNTINIKYAIEQQIIQTENDLNHFLGRYPQKIERADKLDDNVFPESIKSGIPSQILTKRTDVKQAELDLEAAGFDVKSARAEFLPALKLNLNLGINTFNPAMFFTLPASIAGGIFGGLAGPLLNRANIQANFDQQAANNYISYYEYQKKVIGAYKEVMTNMQFMEILKKRYEVKNEEAQVLRNAIDISNELFRTGYASYLDVITARSNYIDTQIQQINVHLEFYENYVSLYKSLGGGW